MDSENSEFNFYKNALEADNKHRAPDTLADDSF